MTAARDDEPTGGAGHPVPDPLALQVADALPGQQLDALPDPRIDPLPADIVDRPIDSRRLGEVFGDEELFPDTTGDERDDRSPQERRDDTHRWLIDNRPPHHDR